jgi:hypothetical protein
MKVKTIFSKKYLKASEPLQQPLDTWQLEGQP